MILPIDIKNCFSQNIISGDFEHELIGSIDEDQLSRVDVLDDDCNRNVLDDGLEKLPSFAELPFSLQMRGNVLMNGNRAAIGHRPTADSKGSAILKLVDEVA